MSETNSAWQCVQIADLLRRVEEAVLEAITVLGTTIHGGIGEGVHRTLGVGEIAGLKEKVAVASDLTDQLAQLGERLPDTRIELSYATAFDGAAADLSEGILDPRMALLAARVLDVKTAWAALAQALLSTDVCAAWEGVTVEQMLLRSRGATRGEARRVIADAGLPAASVFSECSARGIERLATALKRCADS
jgi:hypothetical protein